MLSVNKEVYEKTYDLTVGANIKPWVMQPVDETVNREPRIQITLGFDREYETFPPSPAKAWATLRLRRADTLGEEELACCLFKAIKK